ncbi:MAG: DUF262 domain-containing protein [Tissierellia bacterium]|jgi:hypothetical protein|nr:DUF262 domain-containing protein [Tissierellia bacterium]
MTITELLDSIKSLDLVLPEFQREYVWEKEQGKQLLVSLFKGYPTGSLLFWKTDNPPEIKNMEIPKEKIGTTQVILDGQQRLTTLYLLIKNDIPPYYKEHDIKNDPRNLYFNMETEDFQYYQASRMKNNPVWVAVTDCFSPDSEIDILKIAQEIEPIAENQIKLANVLIKNLTRLKNIVHKEYPIQIVPMSASIDEAIDVFDRVNSMGTKLSDAELALAHICGKWPQARRIIKEKIEELKKKKFNFELNFMVRVLTGVVKGRAIFNKIHESNKEELMDGWKRLTKVLDYIVNILPQHGNIHSTEDLNTTNVLVPLVVYLANNDSKFPTKKKMNEFIHWIYAAHTWSRYTSQTDQRLDHDVSIVLRSDDPCRELIDAIIDQRGRIEVKPNDLEGRWIQDPLYRMTYILCKANNAIDWFNGCKLENTFGQAYQIHSHHIFPVSLLYSEGGYSSENHIHKKIVNEIANRAFLTGESNIRISNKEPKVYLKEIEEKYPGALEKQFIPTDPALWELDRYEDFLAKRRELIANAINQFMSSLLHEMPPKKEETLEDYLAHGEDATVEFKSTCRWDLNTEQVNAALQKVIAKSIAGFLNTQGGVLLIGVSDDGSIIGIENDINSLKRRDRDGFQQALTQSITNYLGAEFCRNIQISFAERDKKTVCIVKVESSPRPVFLEDRGEKEFYIRFGNTTRPLDIEEANKYIGTHW